MDGNVMDTLGWAYFKNGEFKESVDALESAAALMPLNPSVLYHYGMALDKTGDKEQAVKKWQSALDTGIEFPESDAVQAAIVAASG